MSDRISIIERNLAATDSRIHVLERSLDQIAQKMDHLITVITRHEAAPQYDPNSIIDFVLKATILFGLITTGIIYVSSNVNSARLAVLEHHIDQTIMKAPKDGL
jgi:hypothetical protein